MDAFMKDGLNVKPVLLKQHAPEMDAFQQRLFNSQRETIFLLKPDAPKTNAFHVKDVVNIEPFLFDTMPPKMDAFMKDVLNVKPVLLKQNAPEMDAFQQRLFNSQRETYFFVETWCPQNQCLSCQRCCQYWTFFVWHNAPKMDAFMKDVLNVKPVLLKQHAPDMDALSAKTF